MHSDSLTSGHMMRAILDIAAFENALNASMAISTMDTNGVIEYANPKFCKISGYSLDELIPSGAKADSGGDSQRAESLNLWRQVLGGHGHGYSDRIAGGF